MYAPAALRQSREKPQKWRKRQTPHNLIHQTRQQLHATHTETNKRIPGHTVPHMLWGFRPLIEVWLTWGVLLFLQNKNSVFLHSGSSFWNVLEDWSCLTWKDKHQASVQVTINHSFCCGCFFLSVSLPLSVSYTTASSTLLLKQF